MLFDYNLNWMHPEVPFRHIPSILKNGNRFVAADFLRAFDWWGPDGGARARIVSNFFQIVNLKFRIWLFQYIVPHPSLSLSWLFSLILSPLFLFKLTYNLTSSRIRSWVCITLYLVSVGLLSNVVMLSHPAKPLSNFFLILCLFVASQINITLQKEGRFSKGSFLLYLFLLALLFLAFLTDEFCYFIFIAIPILFPQIFLAKQRRIIKVLLYFTPLITFFISIVIIAPRLAARLDPAMGFPYWWFTKIKLLDIYRQFRLFNILVNLDSQLMSHFGPLRLAGVYKPFVYGVLFCCFFYAFRKLSGEARKLFLRIFFIIVLFTIFQTFLMAAHAVFVSGYYYGSNFSVFWVMLLAVLWPIHIKPLAHIPKIIIIFFILASLSGFYLFHYDWKMGHLKMYKDFFPDIANYMLPEGKLTYSLAREAWRSRGLAYIPSGLISQFPIDSYWLFIELGYLSK
jgi:hypothetical protein